MSSEMSSDRSGEVRKLYETGLTVIQISKLLGMTRQGVYYNLNKLGLPLPTEREKQ